jgi:TRAP-type C4-dicarboxylate transport system permease large subunit
VILLLLNVLMLFLGTFMDMGPMIIITTPIFLPVRRPLRRRPGAFRRDPLSSISAWG